MAIDSDLIASMIRLWLRLRALIVFLVYPGCERNSVSVNLVQNTIAVGSAINTDHDVVSRSPVRARSHAH